MSDHPADGEPSGPAGPTVARLPLRGLVIDWGGVLTASLDGAMSDWARRDGVDYDHFRDVMRAWVGPRGRERTLEAPDRDGEAPVRDGETSDQVVAEVEQADDDGPAGMSPVHRLERGEVTTAEFEQSLATELAARGSHVEPDGLLRRLLSGLAALDQGMVEVVRRARAAGIRTALLSNSWGNSYPEELWDGLFDVVVISGRVGMRKPETRIFRHTVELLGLRPQECVMVDDLPHNVRGAVEAGMVAVLHTDLDSTTVELEVLLGLSLRPAPAPGP